MATVLWQYTCEWYRCCPADCLSQPGAQRSIGQRRAGTARPLASLPYHTGLAACKIRLAGPVSGCLMGRPSWVMHILSRFPYEGCSTGEVSGAGGRGPWGPFPLWSPLAFWLCFSGRRAASVRLSMEPHHATGMMCAVRGRTMTASAVPAQRLAQRAHQQARNDGQPTESTAGCCPREA